MAVVDAFPCDARRERCERVSALRIDLPAATASQAGRRPQPPGRTPNSIRIYSMWIVRLALRRPYTFTVMAILIVLMGIVTITRMATDIFPKIDIPVVSVIWSFPGVAPEEMEKRFVTVCERAMTTTVNDIEHIESQSYNGVAVIKVFFHEGAKVEAGVAQVTSICQTLLRIMPPGTTPPLILQYSASNVPILQLGLTSKTLSEQQLYDLGLNFIRTQLATVQGAQVPLPYGGKSRQVMVDIDPQKLFGKGLSPADVSNALNAQNVILPAGTQKIGDREYNGRLNSRPELLQALNDLPIKQVNNATVYIRDVAHVRDGFAVQTNIVAQNRVRSALLTVLKSASASTLDIIGRVKAALPRIKATLPPELDITQLFDQSIFVRAAVNGVLKEGSVAQSGSNRRAVRCQRRLVDVADRSPTTSFHYWKAGGRINLITLVTQMGEIVLRVAAET
jgi:multidrug efflux pump subunit AcrB